MERTSRELKSIVIAALDSEFGFAPKQKQVVLLEAAGDGTYILFQVGKHEYRFDSYRMHDGSIWVGNGTIEITK